jgi:hypothetical protein
LANTSNSERVYIETVLLYKTGLVGKGLFYQSNLATHLFPGRKLGFDFKMSPTTPHTELTHSREFPWENVQKTWL